ncbi:MAG: cache domain-containing protein, partial [Lachnospiraceae bacterium]|nr:cache domain-containing protein [Lachnospiraceae bacterium]
MKEKRKTLKLNFNTMLVAFSVVPMMISIIIMLIMLISTSSAEIKGVTQNSMLSLVKETGTGFESYIKNGESTLKNFAKSPIVVEFLQNQTDAALQKEAQDYTMECFNAAGNMEAIYISNWDSTTLTHPVEKAIGVPTREGDRLKSLQENMLASDDMYNTGIIASPATGKQVVSMYAPVFDDKNNPIGYVGAAVYVNDMAEMFSDTSSMGYDSMYFYTVNGHDGI